MIVVETVSRWFSLSASGSFWGLNGRVAKCQAQKDDNYIPAKGFGLNGGGLGYELERVWIWSSRKHTSVGPNAIIRKVATQQH